MSVKQRILSILIVLLIAGCATGSSGTASNVNPDANQYVPPSNPALTILVAAIATVANASTGVEGLRPQDIQFFDGLAATFDELGMAPVLAERGLAGAVDELCQDQGPSESREPFVRLSSAFDEEETFILVEPTSVGEVSAVEEPLESVDDGETIDEDSSSDDHEDGSVARLQLLDFVGPDQSPISFDLRVLDEFAVVEIQGGGWLLCSLFETTIRADGDPPERSSIDGSVPELVVSAVAFEDGSDDLAAQVTFRLRLSFETLASILTSEELAIDLGFDELIIEPQNSEEAQQLLQIIQETL